MKLFIVIFLLLARTYDLIDVFRYAWLVPTGELPWEVVPPLFWGLFPSFVISVATVVAWRLFASLLHASRRES